MIALAVRALDARFGIAKISGFYASPAWPDPNDPPFVNAAVALLAAPPAEDLLTALHGVEAAFGRRRTFKNAPRTLDLDLLAYGDQTRAGPPVLPHPGLENRDFVLAPLAEIVPGFHPPGAGRSIAALFAGLEKVSAIRIGA